MPVRASLMSTITMSCATRKIGGKKNNRPKTEETTRGQELVSKSPEYKNNKEVWKCVTFVTSRRRTQPPPAVGIIIWFLFDFIMKRAAKAADETCCYDANKCDVLKDRIISRLIQDFCLN